MQDSDLAAQWLDRYIYALLLQENHDTGKESVDL